MKEDHIETIILRLEAAIREANKDGDFRQARALARVADALLELPEDYAEGVVKEIIAIIQGIKDTAS